MEPASRNRSVSQTCTGGRHGGRPLRTQDLVGAALRAGPRTRYTILKRALAHGPITVGAAQNAKPGTYSSRRRSVAKHELLPKVTRPLLPPGADFRRRRVHEFASRESALYCL